MLLLRVLLTRWLARPQAAIATTQALMLLLCGCQPSPALHSPLLPFFLKSESPKRKTQTIWKSVWKQKRHFSTPTTQTKSVFVLRRLQRIKGQPIPKTLISTKNTNCEPILHNTPSFCFGKNYTNGLKWLPKMTPLGLWNPFCLRFEPWGSDQPKRIPQSRPGRPWYSTWSPKGYKRVRKWSPRVAQSSKKTIAETT